MRTRHDEWNGFRPPKASELLADALRSRILLEGLPPGTPLPSEADLVAQSKLSRASVRETLRVLEAEGLIEITRGRGGGAQVREADPWPAIRLMALTMVRLGAPLRDLFALQSSFEPMVAGLAAQAATPEQRQALLVAAKHEHLGTMDVEAATGTLGDFHVLIGEATGNKLVATVQTMLDEVSRLHTRTETLTQADLRETARAHVRIATAIADGDVDAARAAMTRHIRKYERRMDEMGRLDEPVIPNAQWHNPRAAELGGLLQFPASARAN
jgi:DNA-binding FadR family transcriptional regulator